MDFNDNLNENCTKNKSLNLLQWNCRGVRNKFIDLCNISDNFDIIMLIETMLKTEDQFSLKGFNIVRFDRIDEPHGGIAICVREGLIFDKVNLDINNNCLECGSIQIESNFGSILITTCYRKPYNRNNIKKRDWDDFTNKIKQHNADHFFFGGDFNAHHTWWGSSRCCANGNVISDNTDVENFILLNNKSPTHVTLTNDNCNYSNIDLSFVSPDLALMSDWQVGDDAMGSDHFPIAIQINVSPSYQTRIQYKYNLKKFDWDVFFKVLDENKTFFNSIQYSNLEIISRYNYFINFLHESINYVLLNQPGNNKKNSNENNDLFEDRRPNVEIKSVKSKINPCAVWWNEKCTKAKRLRTAAYKSLRHRYTREQFFELKKTVATTKKTLKEEKKLAFVKFSETISPKSDITYVWRKIRLFKNSFSKNNISDGNKKMEKSINDCIEKLTSGFICNDSNLKKVEDINDDMNFNFLDCPFSFEELEFAIKSINTKSAPGIDKINYEIISKLPEFYLRILLDLYNDIFNTKTFPEIWKSYLIVFIPKGKSDKVRPISLASCVLKLMERMINERLQWWFESDELLAKSQYGFRKGKSCIDNLSILTSDIQQNFYKKDPVTAVFLDIKGAYDNVIPKILINDLIDLGLPKKIVAFIDNLISKRNIIYCLNNNIEEKSVCKGLPQGSVLSPILYSIYTRKLESLIENPINILQFADDLCLYNSENNVSIEGQVEKVEREIAKITPWLADRGLELAPEKCVMVVFDNKVKRVDKNIKMKIENKTITVSESTKFLGMYLDRRLNWSKHINYTVDKCKSAMRILSCLRRTWWGADPRTLLMLYKSLVRSRLEYGGFLISPCDEKFFYKLQKVQNVGLRISLGYRNSTPINVMSAEAKIPLLKYRFKELGLKYVLRCMSFENHLLLGKLDAINEIAGHFINENNYKKSLIVQCYNDSWFLKDSILRYNVHFKYEGCYNFSYYKPSTNIDLGIDISKANCPNTAFEHKFPSVSEIIQIFTDGSKLEDNDAICVGFAAWSKNENFRIACKMLDCASIFTAECIAILTVIDKIIEIGVGKYEIFSDSKSAILALENVINNSSPLINRIRQKLAYADSENIDIKLYWIPAHKGIFGNENVDQLAKAAAKTGVLHDGFVPVTDLYNQVKSKCKRENENELKEMANDKGKNYFNIFYKNSVKTWFHDIDLPRKAIVSINRIKCNHTSLNSSLFRHKISDNETCKCGESPDSIDHIVWSCALYERERTVLLSELRKIVWFGPFSVNSLLATDNQKLYHIIGKFLNDIKCRI